MVDNLTSLHPNLNYFTVGSGSVQGNPQKTLELLTADITHLVIGPISHQKRPYDTGDRPTENSSLHRSPDNLITAYDIKQGNNGVNAMLPYLIETRKKFNENGKKVVAAIGCYDKSNPNDIANAFYVLCSLIHEHVDAIELDFHTLTATRKAHAYNSALVKLILDRLKPFGPKFWIKMPHFNVWKDWERLIQVIANMNKLAENCGYRLRFHNSDFFNIPPQYLPFICGVIGNSGIVTTVVGPGSFHQVEVFKEIRHASSRTWQSVIAHSKGSTIGSLSGNILSIISVPQIRELSAIFSPHHIQVIGNGGAGTAQGAKAILDAGATGIAITSSYLDKRVRALGDLLFELDRLQNVPVLNN